MLLKIPQLIFIEPYDDSKFDALLVCDNLRDEKSLPTESQFAAPVSAVRTNPISAVADARRSLQVGLGLPGVQIEKSRQVDTLHRVRAPLAVVNADDTVFITRRCEKPVGQRNRGRGVAHAGVNNRRRDICSRLGRERKLCYHQDSRGGWKFNHDGWTVLAEKGFKATIKPGADRTFRQR